MLKIIVLAINLFYQQNNLLLCFQLFYLLNFFLEGPIATSSYTHCFVKIVAGGCSAATFYINSGTTFLSSACPTLCYVRQVWSVWQLSPHLESKSCSAQLAWDANHTTSSCCWQLQEGRTDSRPCADWWHDIQCSLSAQKIARSAKYFLAFPNKYFLKCKTAFNSGIFFLRTRCLVWRDDCFCLFVYNPQNTESSRFAKRWLFF